MAEDWPIFTLLTIILVKLFQSQIVSFLPDTIKNHFDNRAELKKDQQEHEQAKQLAEMNLLKLREMSQLSSLSFTEEQITQLTAETQTQLNEANSFIRQSVSDKLDILIEGQQFILREMRERRENGSNGTKKLG